MEQRTFHLPEHLDLTAAAPLRAHLNALLNAPLDLDASNVQRVGGLCLQVLLAAATAWRAQGHEFRVMNPSPAYLEAMRQMGVSDLTGWIEESEAA